MMYQKMWKAFMTIACALTLAIALPAAAQTQGSGRDLNMSAISGLSVQQGVLGRELKTRSGENAGMIDDVIFSRQGRVAHYLANVEPFQGKGEKVVALNPDQIQFNGQDYVFNGSRADLAGLPEVNPYDYSLYHGYYGPSGRFEYGPSYGSAPYDRPYSGPYGGAGNMGGPYDQGQTGQYQERQGQYPPGQWQGQQPYPQPNPPRQGYYYGPENMGPGMQQGQMQRPGMGPSQPMVPGMRQGQMMQPGMRQGRMQAMMNRGISSDDFLSASVYDPQNQMIGDVEDLVLDPAGNRITHVVVGIENRKVLVPFHRLRYAGGDSVIYRGTESQLDQMPEYRVDQGGRVSIATSSQMQQKAGSSAPQPQSGQNQPPQAQQPQQK